MIGPILIGKQKLRKNESKLNFSIAQKMIHELLNYDRLEKIEIRMPKYTKKELAAILKINEDELTPFINKISKLKSKKAGKIETQLIPLYLKTKWYSSQK